ncbi:MAG: 6-pyruvoyl-tetrahydropterin synthase-related protein [Candidatus Sumerlaeaceae bacterium]
MASARDTSTDSWSTKSNHALWRLRLRRRVAIHGRWLALVLLAVLYLYGPQLSTHMAIMHESFAVYIRPQQYEEEMRLGFWQPMLLPDTIRGAGYAFPVFYPPFSYSLAALLGILFNERMLGLNTALFLSALVSALGTYACGYSLSRRPSIAALVSILSITVTYRFVNIYVRGALAESWGTAWYPVALYGALELLRIGRRGWWMAVGLAGALTSHTVVTMYFVTMLALVLLVSLLFRWRWRTAVALWVYALLGLALAAWYVVPQQAYLKDVWASDAVYMWAAPEKVIAHSIDFEQLFGAEPERWWGVSYQNPNDTMSFKLGFGYMVVFGAVVLALFRRHNANAPLLRYQRGLQYGLLVVMPIMILFLVWPEPLISILPEQFCYLQFPWRLLSVLPIFAAALLALCLRSLTVRLRGQRDWLMIILCGILVAEVPYFYTIRRLKMDVISETLTPGYAHKYGDKGCTELAEYMPRGYPIEQAENFFIEQPQLINGRLLEWKREPGLVACSAQVECGHNGGRLTLPVTFYPFWKAETAGGQKVELETDRGYISMKVPAGVTRVNLTRGYTSPYYVGWAVTAAGVLALFALGFWGNRWLRGNRPASLQRVLPVKRVASPLL